MKWNVHEIILEIVLIAIIIVLILKARAAFKREMDQYNSLINEAKKEIKNREDSK